MKRNGRNVNWGGGLVRIPILPGSGSQPTQVYGSIQTRDSISSVAGIHFEVLACVAPPPPFFVSVAFKEVSFSISPFDATLPGILVSVVYKGLTDGDLRALKSKSAPTGSGRRMEDRSIPIQYSRGDVRFCQGRQGYNRKERDGRDGDGTKLTLEGRLVAKRLRGGFAAGAVAGDLADAGSGAGADDDLAF